MSYPRLEVDITKLCYNADTVLGWCKEHQIEAAFVGKCVLADRRILNAVLPRGFTAYADSREENLENVEYKIPRILLRIAMADRAEEIVQCADISLQSEIPTIKAIGDAAARAGKKHKVILMIDLGDLREGIYYELGDEIMEAARTVVEHPGLELYGVGTNLTCYGSIMPDETNMGNLVAIAEWLRKELGVPAPIVSGGNSSSVGLMKEGRMPEGVNQLRLGESILLGTDTAIGTKFPELRDDAFILETQLVELKEKPSKPVGVTSVNAFGERVTYVDKGPMRRGILAIGRQDVNLDGLTPLDPRISIVGGSSDHLIVDLTKADGYELGDVVRFKLSYGALLAAYTSPNVTKGYCWSANF
ncbi:MAG: alanine/ornithine racemase family PLP-dependent enzyme [Ruminococcaceae bacterium]|nr:alanine/ornithine racemase family PLP-dependent enzyme [Oscillospiraceae bacterium]